jgi:uncharacterized NAD(P)/FAD-binding protein YdhS
MGDDAVSPRQGSDVAIVGGGAAGALLAIALSGSGLRVVVIEPGEEPGRGVAYSSRDARHRLNVPARRMSAVAADPSHFVAWSGAAPDAFVPRGVYGDYLEALLQQACADGTQVLGDTVVAIEQHAGGVELRLGSGATLPAARAVLAIGSGPAADPVAVGDELRDTGRYVADPWTGPPIDGAGETLLVGTGLTMVDVALGLDLEARGGRALALSRSGLLPRVHRPGQPCDAEPFMLPDAPIALRDVVARVLARVAAGEDARDVVDSLRPVTQSLWQRLDEADRRWFLRDLRRVWEVHRHRMAPEVGRTLDALLAAGRLRRATASVAAIEPSGARVRVTLRDTDGSREVVVDRVVNCTGPIDDVRRAGIPLLDRLLADGVVSPDPLDLGLDVTPAGRASERIHVIGALRKGALYESIAIPELCEQAEALAAELVTAFGSRWAPACANPPGS